MLVTKRNGSTEPVQINKITRRVEDAVAAHGGHKSLYSSVHYPEDEFWRRYDGDAYRVLKQRYDPRGRLPDLYSKVTGSVR